MTSGTLIEFGGLPGSGKSTLAGHLADRTGAVWLRIDEIERAMRRNGLTAAQTGVAAYSVAHDVAAAHLRRGLTVIADAVNPVAAARLGWHDLARAVDARHVVIETACADDTERLRRLAARDPDVLVPLSSGSYEPRSDDRLVVDTLRPEAECEVSVARQLGLAA
jgi:predicted kinase